MNFNGILIGSGDADRLVEYYTRLFGPPGMQEGGYSGWQFGSAYVTVGRHSEVKGQNEAPGYAIATLADPDGNYFQLVSPMTADMAG